MSKSKFVAGLTGQRVTLKDGTVYTAEKKAFEVDAKHEDEMASLGFICSKSSKKEDSAPEPKEDAESKKKKSSKKED